MVESDMIQDCIICSLFNHCLNFSNPKGRWKICTLKKNAWLPVMQDLI